MLIRPERVFACFGVVAFVAGCGGGTLSKIDPVAVTPATPAPTATPPTTFSVSSVKFASPASAFVADQGAQVVAVPLAASDAKGAVIAGTFASPITVSVTDTGAHMVLSIDGTTKAASVTLHSSSDASNLKAYYDGNAGAGYSASIGVTAPQAASETLDAFTVSAAAGYASRTLGVVANHQVTLTASEANFSGTFTAASTCNNTAVVASPVQSGATAQITVTGGLAPGACSITISDGTTQYPAITVNNAVDGATPVPLPTATSGGGVSGGSSPTPLPTASAPNGGVGTSPSPVPLPT